MCAAQGSIQTSEVGPSSTRSARPPARVRSNSSWSRIEPPVRALISRARAATSVRVSPSARNLRNAGERCSAPTNDHQLCSSHWPRRRSSQLVSSVSSRSTKNAVSCGGMPRPVANSSTKRVTSAKSSSDSGRCAGGEQLVAALALREQHALGAHEVAVDADPPHRVRDVAVEAGEEAEAVLGRQVAAPVGPRARDGQAARLAARGGRASRRRSPRSRARPARARRSDPPRRHPGPRPSPSSPRQPNPYTQRVRAITSCAASSGCPARPRRSSRSSPTRGTWRRSRRRGWASRSSRRGRSRCARGR